MTNKKMGRVIIHNLSNEELRQKREHEFLQLNYAQRLQKAYQLMRISFMFTQGKKSLKPNSIIIHN
jgi:hypothetical protein